MSKPIIVFTSDDGYLTNYTKVYPAFRKRGLAMTQYIIGNSVPALNSAFSSPLYLKRMQEAGMDMQCHTYTHLDSRTGTESELHDEMTSVNGVFDKLGFAIPRHHAYPYGYNNALTKSVYGQHRKTLRLTGDVLGNYNTYDAIRRDPLAIKGFSCDIQDEAKFALVRKGIDQAIANDGILVLYFHYVRDHAQISIKEGYLDKLLDYVVSTGVRVMTFDEMYNHVFKD